MKGLARMFEKDPFWFKLTASAVASSLALAVKACADAYVRTHTPAPAVSTKKEADMSDVVDKLDEILKKLNEPTA